MKLNRDKVLAAYADGVDAVEATAARVASWSVPTPCSEWRAIDLAGHMVAIARYYHKLLDAAVAGRPRMGLPTGTRLALMNARELSALPVGDGPSRIGAFLHLARRYNERLVAADWHMVLGTWDGLGALTLAQHTALAIGEWHLHAWDLARSAGLEHRPSDAATVAAGRSAVLPEARTEDPWLAVLIGSGRLPGAAVEAES